MGIQRLNQRYLLATPPPFDFFFAGDRGIGIDKMFVIDEPVQVLAAGKARM